MIATLAPAARDQVAAMVRALVVAEMDEVLALLRERVFGSARVCTLEEDRVVLRPFAELAFLELRAIATCDTSSADRLARSVEVLMLAGLVDGDPYGD